MKKFISLALALVMALSLTTMAWGADVTLTANTPATANNAVAISGSNCEYATALAAGETFNGAGYTYTVTGSDAAKEDVAIYLTGDAIIENVVIDCAGRGIDTDVSAVTSVVIDNVTILNSERALHIQAPANLDVSNSTFAGKISYVLSGGTATFTNCTFKANSALTVKGNMVEPWSETVFVNCVFEDGFEVSFDDWNNVNADSSKAMTLTDCIYDGAPLTADNVDDLFINTTGVDVDDVTAVSHAADGASNTYTGLYAKATTEGAAVVAIDYLSFFKAVDNEVDEDGAFEEYGNVAYYTVSGDPYFIGKYYAEVKTLAAADVVVSTDAAGKAVYMYLDEIVDPFYYGDGVVTKNFGTACGQYNSKNVAYDKKATYYVAFETLYVGDKVSPSEWLMVNGQLVGVDVAFDDVVAHATVYTRDEDGKITAIKCSKCGAVAVKAPNFLSMPKGADRVAGTDLWYFPAAGTTGTTSSTVQSAQTFDAGIAMYVGMSVMAAAGSAVVIGKKKD